MAPHLVIDGHVFRDTHGREITLRGINIDGAAKCPKTPDQPSHVSAGFFDGDNVSFVGRPFPLEEAHVHFSRLREWGFNELRYIFTWEAIEHEGPGKYDDAWVDFTIEVLRLAGRYGLYVHMDPHQDVWSRHCGGSGAPMWTLYAAGLDPRGFQATQAAIVQNTLPDPTRFQKMIWSTSYTRLACQVIFTLFWAGREFAPKAILDGVNIQDYLQTHFINACRYLAQRIHDAGGLEDEVIIGWETLNEPNRGLLGVQDISKIPPEQQLKLGTTPTAFQAMLTGAGRACEVPTYAFGSFGPYKIGSEVVDPRGVTAWVPEDYDDSRYGWTRDPQWKLGQCIWAQHGVWDPQTDTLLRPEYFASNPQTGERYTWDSFTEIHFLEHVRRFREAIRSVHADAILYVQPPILDIPPSIKGTDLDDPRMVHAIHFYDGMTLMTKHWNQWFNVDVIGVMRGKYLTPALAVRIGETRIRNCLRDQLRYLRDESSARMGAHPVVFTEIGIPYDMDDNYAYRTGDYTAQSRAMDANAFAVEGSGAQGFDLWNYTSVNCHRWGDAWNGEDLSIVSRDDALPTLHFDAPNPERSAAATTTNAPTTASHRAAEAFIRPSPVATHGRLCAYGFDLKQRRFSMSLVAETAAAEEAPTVCFLPRYHFSEGERLGVRVSGGRWRVEVEGEGEGRGGIGVQVLKWWHGEGRQEISVSVESAQGEGEGEGCCLM